MIFEKRNLEVVIPSPRGNILDRAIQLRRISCFPSTPRPGYTISRLTLTVLDLSRGLSCRGINRCDFADETESRLLLRGKKRWAREILWKNTRYSVGRVKWMNFRSPMRTRLQTCGFRKGWPWSWQPIETVPRETFVAATRRLSLVRPLFDNHLFPKQARLDFISSSSTNNLIIINKYVCMI